MTNYKSNSRSKSKDTDVIDILRSTNLTSIVSVRMLINSVKELERKLKNLPKEVR